jgi:hypothetical protein
MYPQGKRYVYWKHPEICSPETLLALKVEKPLNCSVDTWRPKVSIIEHSFLFLKTLIKNKASRFCPLEYRVLKCK